jgi:hypothetical protein
MNIPSSALFNLLPALYRIRDAQIAGTRNLLSAAETAELQSLRALLPPLTAVKQDRLDSLLAKASRGPLESLLMVVEEQLAILSDNLDQMYDDQFIETCAPWVISYIGDLIGYQAVNGIAPAVASPRAEVAHTISFRRRKGTVLMMEQLARDVTGWGAHAVEFFLRLADTQYMNHLRSRNLYAPDLREWEPAAYMNSGFDETAHTVDVRRIAIGRGRYNIQNIGIFLWSLTSYSVTHTPLTAVPGQPGCFRFSHLGRDLPLFNFPVSQGADVTAPATPLNVSDRLLRRVLCRDIWKITARSLPPEYYADGLSLALYNNNSFINASGIRVCNLSGADGAWNNLPKAGDPICIDPELGRIAVPPDEHGSITATYYYGFNADLGGGEYDRHTTFTSSPTQAIAHVPANFPTIHQALAALGGDGVVEIADSGIYTEPTGLDIAVKAHGHIELRAADGSRPTLLLGDAIRASGGIDSLLDINGLWIGYEHTGATPPALLDVHAIAGNVLTTLRLSHLTIVPGWALNPDGSPAGAYAGLPALRVMVPGVSLQVVNSIVGSIHLNAQSTASLTNSVIDATDPSGVAYVDSIDGVTNAPLAGGALTLVGCTVIGKVYASLLSLVSNSIVWAWLTNAEKAAVPLRWQAPLWSARRQEGCVRFSYLPERPIVPRQFECVTMARGVPQPCFYSLRFGDPAYAKLIPSTDDLIRRGADDGGEMGVFHFLLAPLRETDLKIRMREYLPVGLEFGVFYQD